MKVENTAEKLFFKLIKDYLTAVEDMLLPGAVHSRLTHTHTLPAPVLPMLQKPVLQKPSTRLGELKNSGLSHQRARRS